MKNTLTYTQRNGGWISYWRLVFQLYGQIPQYWDMIGQIKEEKIITRFTIIMLVINMIIKTPLVVIY